MHYHELIQLYFERSGALQSLWTLCVVVMGALLAFSSLRKVPDLATTLLVSVLYVIFAYQNLAGLRDAATQRLAVLQTIKQTTADSDETRVLRAVLEPTLTPATPDNVRNFHLVSDALTLAAIWAMELRRRRVAGGRG